MDAIQLKKTSGSGAEDFSVILFPFFVTDETKYSTLSFKRKRIVHGKHRAWEIKFSLLTVAQQNYLNEISYEEEPQFIYSSTTYDVEIVESSIKASKGTMTIMERETF